VILVDSSVWIAHLRGHRTRAAIKLEQAAGREPLLIGDLILLEVLQGARDEAHAAHIERGTRRWPFDDVVHWSFDDVIPGSFRAGARSGLDRPKLGLAPKQAFASNLDSS
jgi:predicted nucleic acid-binding protein